MTSAHIFYLLTLLLFRHDATASGAMGQGSNPALWILMGARNVNI